MSKMPSPLTLQQLLMPRANITTRDLLKAQADPVPPSTVSGDASGLLKTLRDVLTTGKQLTVGNPEDAFDPSLDYGGQTQVGPVMGPSITLPWGPRTSGTIDAGLALFGARGIVDGMKVPYYSQLEKTLLERAPAKATGEQFLNIAKKGAKAEELNWSGLEDLLKSDPAKKWTRDGLLAHVKTNLPELHEKMVGQIIPPKYIADKFPDGWFVTDQTTGRVFGRGPGAIKPFKDEADAVANISKLSQEGTVRDGNTKFTQYTLPGGENHRELVVTMPPTQTTRVDPFTKWLSGTTVGNVVDNLDLQQGYGIMHLLGTQGVEYESPLTRSVYEQLPEEVRNNLHKDYVKARQSFTDDELGIEEAPLSIEDWAKQQTGYRHGVDDVNQSPYWQAGYQEYLNGGPEEPKPVYNVPSGHSYGDPALDVNRLFHARFNDRTTEAGERALHMDELQSDWHQEGREKGYAGKEPAKRGNNVPTDLEIRRWDNDDVDTIGIEPRVNDWVLFDRNGDPIMTAGPTGDVNTARGYFNENWDDLDDVGREPAKGVPDAPFKKTWHELGMKRALQEAAQGGYDRLTWTTGAQQADRYSLAKHVDSLSYEPHGNLSRLRGTKNGNVVVNQAVKPEELASYIGEEAAAKLLKQPLQPIANMKDAFNGNPVHAYQLSGDDLQVGGTGMKGFYDKMLPDFVNRYGKKWGAKAEKVSIGTNGNGADLSNDIRRLATEFRLSPGQQRYAPVLGEVARHVDELGKTPENALKDVHKFWMRDTYGDPTGNEALDSEEWADIKKTLQKIEAKKKPTEVWSVKITPEMKADLLGEGQPMYSLPVPAAKKEGATTKDVMMLPAHGSRSIQIRRLLP